MRSKIKIHHRLHLELAASFAEQQILLVLHILEVLHAHRRLRQVHGLLALRREQLGSVFVR